MCGFGGSVGEDVRAGFSLSQGENLLPFYPHKASVRSGDSDLDSPEVRGPRGQLIGPGRV